MNENWQMMFYQIADEDIRWAKNQSWSVLQWTVIILAGIAAVSREVDGNPSVFVGLSCVGAIVATFYLYDLHSFAKKSRKICATMAQSQNASELGISSRYDKNHYFYLTVQLLIVVIMLSLAIAMIVAGGPKLPQHLYNSCPCDGR